MRNADALGGASRHHRGISLVEVLISMFVLLIGLMGVAAMFPVGTYYMVKAEQLDRGSAVALSASEELVTRGLLSPNAWRNVQGLPVFESGVPLMTVVIDPLGVAAGIDQFGQNQVDNVAIFPRDDQTPAQGDLRPVRVTVPDGVSQIMSKAVADMIFTARDDLAFALPNRKDLPANLLFDDELGASIPKPLRRQTLGEYSWLVTVGPRQDALGALVTGRDPDLEHSGLDHGTLEHSVSVVVFHKRNLAFPSPSGSASESELNERVVDAQILTTGLGGGEVQLVAQAANELSGMRQGEWIALFGSYPSGAGPLQARWFFGWYRIVSMDLAFEESDDPLKRIVSLNGPRWPWLPNETARAGLVAGAIAVHTMTMRLQSDSPWSVPEQLDVGMPGGAANAAR